MKPERERWWDHDAPDLTVAELIAMMARAANGMEPARTGVTFAWSSDLDWIGAVGLSDRYQQVMAA